MRQRYMVLFLSNRSSLSQIFHIVSVPLKLETFHPTTETSLKYVMKILEECPQELLVALKVLYIPLFTFCSKISSKIKR